MELILLHTQQLHALQTTHETQMREVGAYVNEREVIEHELGHMMTRDERFKDPFDSPLREGHDEAAFIFDDHYKQEQEEALRQKEFAEQEAARLALAAAMSPETASSLSLQRSETLGSPSTVHRSFGTTPGSTRRSMISEGSGIGAGRGGPITVLNSSRRLSSIAASRRGSTMDTAFHREAKSYELPEATLQVT
jgi:hypothetical protein